MKKVAALCYALLLTSPVLAQPNRYTRTTDNYQQERSERMRRRNYDDRPLDSGYGRYWNQHLIQMSVRLAPMLTLNTAEGSGQYLGVQPGSAAGRLSAGLNLDYFFFQDKYAFSTGLWYSVMQVSYQLPGSFGRGAWVPGAAAQRAEYNLQFVQVPISTKLFATLSPDLRFYVQAGGLLNVKTGERPLDRVNNALSRYADATGEARQFGFADVSVLLGSGVQYRLGQDMALNLGLSYQRGLLNVARDNDVTTKLRAVSLDVALVF